MTGRGPGRAERLREVVTPEGVPLRFEVALAGDRAGAFLLDLLAVAALVLTVAVPLGVLAARDRIPGDVASAGAILAVFLVRTFYFPFFELAWKGQTPGKRRLHLRVVDGGGGPLSAEAVIVRNLTRELELFLPIVGLFAPVLLFPGAPGWARLLPLAWMLLFGLLPLFNRDRLRVGDLVAGTVVIRTPQAVLLEDLAAAGPREAVAFTEAQLDAYGAYELQVLERVLRLAPGPGQAEAIAAVASSIRARTGWTGEAADRTFLEAYYAALRARLERRLLLGRRRASKHDRDG